MVWNDQNMHNMFILFSISGQQDAGKKKTINVTIITAYCNAMKGDFGISYRNVG